ncbi:MAG TPA: ferritin family protein [Anaeromyxobacteraceae bacterium]|nr:ferritin family protein [Anaeromyxobacteraceae bacterium]
MPTTYDLLRRAERIETTAAEIYGALAAQFAASPAARSLFESLAAEELQHASRIRLLTARYKHDARLVARRSADAPALEACLAEAEGALAEIRTGRWRLDLAATKRRLGALEDRLGVAHAEVLARDGNPDLREFFEQLARQDAAHARLLIES